MLSEEPELVDDGFAVLVLDEWEDEGEDEVAVEDDDDDEEDDVEFVLEVGERLNVPPEPGSPKPGWSC